MPALEDKRVCLAAARHARPAPGPRVRLRRTASVGVAGTRASRRSDATWRAGHPAPLVTDATLVPRAVPGAPGRHGVGIAPGSPSAHVSASIPQTATTHCHEEPGRPGVRRRSDASFRGPRRRLRAARGGRAVDCTGDGTHGASRSPRAALCPAAGRPATDAAVGGSARGGSADGPGPDTDSAQTRQWRCA